MPRICKDCGVSEEVTKWVTKHGKSVGMRCRACGSACSRDCHQNRRRSAEGRAKANETARKANYKYRTTIEGRTKKNTATLHWARENPDKHNANNARRRAIKLQCTPKWLTKEHFKEIEWFYTESQRLTKLLGILHHVDHIVPLQGNKVSGLHVPWNLQILTSTENLSKGNR